MIELNQPSRPGRFGHPDRTIAEDSRADPRLVAAMEALGLTAHAAPAPVDASSSSDDLFSYVLAAEAGFEAVLLEALGPSPTPAEGIVRSIDVIEGPDGNDITLYIHEYGNSVGPRPAVLHMHGGAMVLLEAAGEPYGRWRDALARQGVLTVGVEFRNGGGKRGNHPFPAGLRDCAAALRWIDARRQDLGISSVVLSGESGGGNLALATALLAKRDGNIEMVDGVYVMCPFISGAYADPPEELPSLYENNGYFVECSGMAALAHVYDPDHAHSSNPLAWPYHATVDELAGLPPHVISVNELDPLRDEGLAYYRRLAAAGVSVACRTVNGTCHAGDMIFEAALPELYAATVREIAGFAHSL